VRRPKRDVSFALAESGETLRAQFAELWAFGLRNAVSCVFPLFVFGMLALTKRAGDALPIPRYDALFLACLGFQALMVALRLETRDELKVICVFHALGLGLELFKVHVGSWSYPDPALFSVGGVPLFSGFMYASVASYMIQAWRRLDLELVGWPRRSTVVPLGAAIYVNFFTHHALPDLRWILAAVVVLVTWRTEIRYRALPGRVRSMRAPVAFLCIGLFVWFAENIATFLGAWVYPHQEAAWSPVHLMKLSSWALLVIVTFLIVAELRRLKDGRVDRYTPCSSRSKRVPSRFHPNTSACTRCCSSSPPYTRKEPTSAPFASDS
jgi:uncharacterized membrane protein YoaT (DUF817 family)